MKVIRTMPPEGWVPTANVTAQQRRLSWRAKGLLVDLLSFPDGYNITFDKLMHLAKMAGDPDVEGRDAMRRAMQELERKGYLAHRRVAVENPAPGKQRWRTETAICDQPIFAAQPGGTDSQHPQDSVPPDFGTSKDQEVSNNTGFTKNDQQQEEQDQSSSSLASAREGAAGKQDRGAAIEADLRVRYETIQQADEPYLRDRLLKFERKRPAIFRKYRNAAISQIENGEWPKRLQEVGSSRLIDELSMMYAVRHYAYSDSGIIPEWLFRFPLRSVS